MLGEERGEERDMTSTLVARPVEARLRPLCATGFIHGFALWYSIEKLFMVASGLRAGALCGEHTAAVRAGNDPFTGVPLGEESRC